jgi:hypothetical protein
MINGHAEGNIECHIIDASDKAVCDDNNVIC